MSDVFDLNLDDQHAVRDHARSVALSGGDKSECPLAPTDPLWGIWQRSWANLRADQEAVSGAMRYRTNLMKAEVRRQTEHLWHNQPDPCADVIERTPLPYVPAAMWDAALNTARAFEEAARATSEVFVTFTDNFSDLMADLQGIVANALPDERSSTRRLRHGSAATCPRHGATRGGTCMKCVRGRH